MGAILFIAPALNYTKFAFCIIICVKIPTSPFIDAALSLFSDKSALTAKNKKEVISLDHSSYETYAKNKSPRSNLFRDCLIAFAVGGSICCLGQILLTVFSFFGLDKDSAVPWVSISLIFLSCLFTGIGWYDSLADYAGAGTLVPITGFANAMSSPAIDNKAEGLVLGLGAKIFIICGPVILYGVVFSFILGLLAFALRNFGIDLTGVI